MLYDVEGVLASIEGARRYGVVVKKVEATYRVDREAMAALRDEKCRDRGNEPPLFDDEPYAGVGAPGTGSVGMRFTSLYSR